MPSELLIFAHQFYKLASAKDLSGQFDWLKNKLELEDGWNNVTDEATARIFFQELKSKPGEHKDKVKATKLLYEIKKALSAWRESAIKCLNMDEYRLLAFPYTRLELDGSFIIISGIIREFQRISSKFGGLELFSDEHLKKLFQAIDIFEQLMESSINLKSFPLQEYAKLIYLSEEELFQKLKRKIEKKLEKNKGIKARSIERFESDIKNLCLSLFHVKKMEFSNPQIDSYSSRMIDIVRDALEDFDNQAKAEKTILAKFSKLFQIDKNKIVACRSWSEIKTDLRNEYESWVEKSNQIFKNVLQELVEKKSVSNIMVQDFYRANF